MNLGKLGVIFGFVSALAVTGVYLRDVLKSPENRGPVGNLAIKALDTNFTVDQTAWNKFETSKTRVVSNSLNGEGKFNSYLDRLLGEKAKNLHNPANKEGLYKIAQELKKLSVDDMRKSGLDEDELRGFFHYIISITDKKYVAEPSEKESLQSLASKTVYALEVQQASYVAAFGAMGEFIQQFSAKEVWGQADILLALTFPRTEFQKNGFNQLVAKQYLIQNFSFKEDDFTQAKLLEASPRLNPLETLRHTDKAKFLKIDSYLNCLAAFTATSNVAGRGVVIGIDVTKGFNYFVVEVNSLVGDKAAARTAIETRIKDTAKRFLTDEGPEQIAQEFYVCGKSYGHHFQ